MQTSYTIKVNLKSPSKFGLDLMKESLETQLKGFAVFYNSFTKTKEVKMEIKEEGYASQKTHNHS